MALSKAHGEPFTLQYDRYPQMQAMTDGDDFLDYSTVKYIADSDTPCHDLEFLDLNSRLQLEGFRRRGLSDRYSRWYSS